jgi:hypothetical protein
LETKISSLTKSNNNDPRFASVSSYPIDSLDEEDYGTYSSKVYSILGGALSVTKKVASNIQDKVKEYEIGDKLIYAGGKTADILYNASFKIYEKGSEIAVFFKLNIYFLIFLL